MLQREGHKEANGQKGFPEIYKRGAVDPSEDLVLVFSLGLALLFLFIYLLSLFVEDVAFFRNPALVLPAVMPFLAAAALTHTRFSRHAGMVLLLSLVGYIIYFSFMIPDLVVPVIYLLAVCFPLILIPPLRVPARTTLYLMGLLIVYMVIYAYWAETAKPALVVFPVAFCILTGFAVWFYSLNMVKGRDREDMMSLSLNRLYRFAMEWSHTASFDTALQAALDVLVDTFPRSRIAIMLPDDGEQNLIIRASAGYPFEVQSDYSISMQTGLSGWAFRTGEGVRVGNVSRDDRYVTLDPDVQSEMCIPLRAGTRTAGIINLESTDRLAYSEEDEQFLETMAPLLASFIINAQLQLQARFLADMNQTLLETAPAGMITYTYGGECIYVNQAMADILGENLASVLSKNLYELPHWKRTGLTETAQKAFNSASLQKLDPGVIQWDGGKVIEYYLKPFNINSEPHLLIMAVDNTEKARILRALEDERNFISTVLENASALVMVLDSAGAVRRFNAACEQLAGVSASEVIGEHVKDVLNVPGTMTLSPFGMKERFEESDLIEFSAPWILKDGSARMISWSNKMVSDDLGALSFVIAVGKDITDEQEAARKLHLQAEALNSAANGIVITDTQGKIEWVNPAVTLLTGYSADELLGENPRVLKSGRQDEGLYREMWETVSAGKVWHGRLINRRKDGSLYHEDMTITPVRDDEGDVQHFIAIKRDVSGEQAMEQALRASEARFRAFITGASVGMFIGSEDGRFIEINPALAVMVGYSVEELSSLHIINLVHPADEEESSAAYYSLLQGRQEQIHTNVRVIRKNGQLLWARVSMGLVHSADDSNMYVIGIIEDVTERHWAEEALEQSERRLEQITNSVDQCIYSFSITRDGELVSPLITPSISKFSGYNVQAHLVDPDLWLDTIHPDDRDRLIAKSEPHTATDERVFLTYRVLDRDRRLHWIKDDIYFEFDATGRPVRMDGVLTDITDLKSAQAALEEQIQIVEKANSRLRELDRLKSNFLANISHELRTPLNSIIGFAELMVDGLAGDLNDQQQEFISDIHSSGRHLLELINDILDLSKIEAGRLEIHPETFDFSVLVDETVSSVAHLYQQKKQHLQTDIQEDLPFINADRVRMKQVLLNLLSNAHKFTLEDGDVRLHASRLDHSAMLVSVSDTGIGIAEEDYESVFEEFQQVDSSATREAQGTGLGIPISRRIVEMHGGRLWMESELGKGTTFTFILPFTGPVEIISSRSSENVLDPHKEPRPVVLVIEDDRRYANILGFHFNLEGYEVSQIYRGQEALARAVELEPCLITLDLMLPDMDGWEILEQLKSDERTRDIPVAVLSALDEGEAGWGLWREFGAIAHLVKPIQHDHVVNLLAEFDLFPTQKTILLYGDQNCIDAVEVGLKGCAKFVIHRLEPVQEPAGFATWAGSDMFVFHAETSLMRGDFLERWMDAFHEQKKPVLAVVFSDQEVFDLQERGFQADGVIRIDPEFPLPIRQELVGQYKSALTRLHGIP